MCYGCRARLCSARSKAAAGRASLARCAAPRGHADHRREPGRRWRAGRGCALDRSVEPGRPASLAAGFADLPVNVEDGALLHGHGGWCRAGNRPGADARDRTTQRDPPADEAEELHALTVRPLRARCTDASPRRPSRSRRWTLCCSRVHSADIAQRTPARYRHRRTALLSSDDRRGDSGPSRGSSRAPPSSGCCS